jgi:hypothetical protein
MDLPVPGGAFFADPAAALKSGLVTLHLLGLVLGLGAATVLDLVIVRFLIRNRVTGDYWNMIEFCSKVVTAGLILLWLSGLGFLIHYGAFDPSKLMNQKVWAKIAIVVILTLNGAFIHGAVLPLVRQRIGRGLFDGLPPRQQSLLLASGAVSATSWYVPLILGAVPQFNGLPVASILLAYAVLLAVAVATARGLARTVLPRLKDSHSAQEALLRRVALLASTRLEASAPSAAPMSAT